MRRVGSVEFDCVCACIAGRATDVRVLAAAANVDKLVQVATRHGVTGLVVRALEEAGATVPPALARISGRRRGAALRHAREAVRLRDGLAEAGVQALFLKGVALSRRAFGRTTLRDAADIDLAVASDRVADAWAALVRLGYAPLSPRRPLLGHEWRLFMRLAKDASLRTAGSGPVVELHWRLSDDLADPSLPPPTLWSRAVVLPGETLATLPDDRLFAYLCAHGAAHGWARLKWLADVAALLAEAPDRGEAFWRAAEAGGDGVAVRSAFAVLEDVLGVSPPPGAPVRRSRRVRALAAIARGTLTAGAGTRDLAGTRWRGWTEFASKLLIAPNAASRGALARRLLISAEDVGQVALPPGAGLGYVALRVPLLIARRRARAARRRAAGNSSVSASRTPSASS